MLDQLSINAARDLGWDVAVAGEARLAIALSHAGLDPSPWVIQFKLGPYRLDFAHPLYRLDVEGDGWVHTTSKVRRRDRERDRQLQAWGWDVIRIDTDSDEAIAKAVDHLVRLVIALPRHNGALWREGERHSFG